MNGMRRSGFSLLEVLLATGILLGASIVLSELAGIGSRQAARARDLAQAQLLCQSKLSEIVAGIAPLTPAKDGPLADAPDWTCSIETAPAGRLNLVLLTVTVSQRPRAHGKPTTFSLRRWVTYKSQNAADAPGETAASPSSSSISSDSSSILPTEP